MKIWQGKNHNGGKSFETIAAIGNFYVRLESGLLVCSVLPVNWLQ